MLENGIVVTKIALALFVQGNHFSPMHKDRPTHGLAFNVGCKGIYTFDGKKSYECNSGECIYLPKGSSYTVKKCGVTDPKKSGVYAINFLTLTEPKSNTPFVLPIKAKDEIQSLFHKAAIAWQKKNTGHYEECFSCLYRIIKQIKKERESYSSKNECFVRISPALKYIDENYLTESITVSKLAELCDFSEAYLRRIFQSLFSASPSVYVRNKRLNYAKELLDSGEYSVTDVAMLSGFNDTAYFVREFKKLIGQTPSEYRKKE